MTDAATPDLTGNPLAQPSPLPLQYPRFDAIRSEHVLQAFEAGMAEHLAQVEAITANPEPPSFENTVVALEQSGQLLRRTELTFFNLAISDSSQERREIEATVAPLLAAHEDRINLNPALFQRISTIASDVSGLDSEQQRLVERYHLDMVRGGAGVDAAGQERLRAINTELSTLGAEFNRLLLAEAAESSCLFDSADQLAGLSPDRQACAKAAADERGLDGYLITMVLPTVQPDLEPLRDRDSRARLQQASMARGARGNANDTRALTSRIVALRAERAALLGYPHHAAYVAADETARTHQAVNGMLDRLVGPATRNVARDLAQLESLLHADGFAGPLQAHDWTHYQSRVRAQQYDVDTEALKPYFNLRAVVDDGIFFAANALYGISFQRRTDLPTYHPDVEVYDVWDVDGSHLALFLADWYARDSKRGGAWMSSFVEQNRLLDQKPVIVINLNVPKPPAGQPALMTQDEVRTAFHEFGHVLHGLFSNVTYPKFSGTCVPRDFVEYPSQVNEMWALHPSVLPNYARHVVTGEPLPQELAEKLRAAQVYGEAFATTEYLGAAILDQEWHLLSGPDASVPAEQVQQFEAQALRRRGIAVEQVPPRYRTTYFAHIFAGDYAAGYYAYIWSEVLDADTVDWFAEHGGLTRANGDRFRATVLSVGGSKDPLDAFRELRGRDADIGPLLKRRGLDS